MFQYHEEYSSVSVTHTMERVSHEKGNSVLLYPASPLLQFEEKSIIPSIPQFFSSPSSFSPSLLQIISSLVQHHHFVVAPSVTFWIMSSLVPLFPSVTPSGLHCTFFLPSATPSGYQVKAESQSLLSLIPSAHVSCSPSFNQSSIHAIRRLRSEPTTHGNGC